ncbi:MAG: 50S ribosomal protein L13 [Christensenellales bacterium]
MKTFMAKGAEIERKWYVINAEGKVLGRLATQVATILRGKNKAIYTPHVDTGDHVIVINAAKVAVTGGKLTKKIYRHHSMHPGGMKEIILRDMLEKKPEYVIEHAVKGMLPNNSLGRQMLTKLRVYRDATHNHQAQNPVELELE